MPAEQQLRDELQLLTKKHCAIILDCSVPYINTLMDRGDIEVVHIGPRGVRITLDSLRKFMGK